MLGKNGGKTVRVLKAGIEGQPSTVLVDLELDFAREGYENLSVARDFAFVQRNGKTLLVMPSGTSHDVAIVDFDDNFATTYVKFTDQPFENTAPHGRYRSVEWAVGTDYVWTNDSQLDEHYVIDVVKGQVVKTITGIRRSSMLSVQNYEKQLQEKMMQGAQPSQPAQGAQPSQPAQAAQPAGATDEEETDPLVIASIVIASLALIVGIVNLMKIPSKPSYAGASNKRDIEVAEQPLQVEKINDPRDDPLGVST